MLPRKDPKGSLNPSGLAQQFSNLFNAYSKAFNKVYQHTGSLFEHPFHRIAINNDTYFLNLVHYIHANPRKHGFVEDLREYPYSSYHTLCSERPTRVARAEVLERFDGRARFEEFHRQRVNERLVLDLIGDDIGCPPVDLDPKWFMRRKMARETTLGLNPLNFSAARNVNQLVCTNYF
ncbi:MAG TPA: hypothetical protein VFD70_13315 [Anaerolineae bacterium]|nr:hypothetical protein [Anaerolineae bacterium]